MKHLLEIFCLVRHVPVIYVDYPGETSLKQIYGTFNRAMLRIVPSLKPWADSLTNAMVEFYLLSQVSTDSTFSLSRVCFRRRTIETPRILFE